MFWAVTAGGVVVNIAIALDGFSDPDCPLPGTSCLSFAGVLFNSDGDVVASASAMRVPYLVFNGA